MTDTSSILIVPFVEDYVKRTFLWIKPPEFQRLFLMRGEPTMETHRAYFKRVLKDISQEFYAILFEGQHIGNCGIKKIKLAEKKGEIWIYIGESELRRRGIGKYATQLLIRKGFETLGLKTMCVHVAEFNLAAIKMYERLGFVVDEGPRLSDEWTNRDSEVIRMKLKKTP